MLLQLLVVVGLCQSAAAICPHKEAGLTPFSTLSNTDKDSDVAITTSVLVDVPSVEVNTITVKGQGRLIFNQGLAIKVTCKGIMVQDSGALIIGSEDCRHEDDVTIHLEGERSADRSQLADAGEKYIAVQDSGVLQIYGKEKVSWTKLTSTVDRHNADTENVIYSHVRQNFKWRGNEGLSLYRFCCADEIDKASVISYQFFDTISNNVENDQERVDAMVEALEEISDGELVGISLQYYFYDDAVDFDDLFDKIEDVAGIERGEIGLRKAKKWDAFALVFIKGQSYSQDHVSTRTAQLSEARASLEYEGRRLTAVSKVYRNNKSRGYIDFRILNLAVGSPTVTVLDNVRGNWNVGDEVLLASTDYDVNHAEIRRIKEFVSDNSFKLDGELDYRHFGEIENRVDMRAEVALLSRNIRIEGVIGACADKENCDMGFSTYGGHVKVIKSFGSVVIDGAALRYMGQAYDKGNYPIHFHMCKNITGKTALVRHNVIRDSYSRAITVHGTFGSSETALGVQLIENVAHNIFGHGYFLEDGAEMATKIDGNIASRVKNIKNGFETDKRTATGFWITNPKTIMVNNVATGCDAHGIWYTFPLEPVGPSKGLVYSHKEAKHTPLWTFDNNVAHSNGKTGMNFDNILVNDNGKVIGCMNYAPVSDPLDPTSTPVKVQLARFTAYKNKDWNMWIRGGLFEVIQMSSAESRRGLQAARASRQPQFVRKSIFIGQSTKNAELEGYPDAMPPESLERYSGFVVYDGPVYISESFFDKFTFGANDTFFSTAIGFKTNNKIFSSVGTSFRDIRFGFKDDGTSSKRVFDGNILDDEVLGFGNFDGDESATLRDLDGSIARCPGDTQFSQMVKPEKYSLTENCMLRENWKMAICDEKYGKVQLYHELFKGTPKNFFDGYASMRRRSYSDATDLAYEDHVGGHRSNFLVVLGNTQFYYDFQYHGKTFPRHVRFYGIGVERDYPLVMGVCLPKGTTKKDISIVWATPDDIRYHTDTVRWVDSLEDVAEEGMPRMFLDGRMLYFMLASRKTRNNNWDAFDYQDSPGAYSPFMALYLARNLPLTPCYDVPASEIDAEYYTKGLPRMTCDLPASTPEEDWGVGDTTMTSRDGNWGEWGQWSECCNDKGAAPVTTYRYRLCDNPPKYGEGADCPGEAVLEEQCAVACPVNGAWTSWGQWSDCFCDGVADGTKGVYTRTRECLGTSNYGEYCRGAKEEEDWCSGDCGQH